MTRRRRARYIRQVVCPGHRWSIRELDLFPFGRPFCLTCGLPMRGFRAWRIGRAQARVNAAMPARRRRVPCARMYVHEADRANLLGELDPDWRQCALTAGHESEHLGGAT